MLVEVGDMIGGTLRVPNHPIRFDSIPDVPTREARRLGADNESVLRDYLHLDSDDIARLRQAGTVGGDQVTEGRR
jgi:crotonobetainyl-CoA:carnitine CoA-transferase CaiB-like acyl-CoA transferase